MNIHEMSFMSDDGRQHLVAIKQDKYLDTLDKEYLCDLFKHLATEMLILTDEHVNKYEAARILGKSVSWIEKASSNPKTKLQLQVFKCRLKDVMLDEESTSQNTAVTFSRNRLIDIRENYRTGGLNHA